MDVKIIIIIFLIIILCFLIVNLYFTHEAVNKYLVINGSKGTVTLEINKDIKPDTCYDINKPLGTYPAGYLMDNLGKCSIFGVSKIPTGYSISLNGDARGDKIPTEAFKSCKAFDNGGFSIDTLVLKEPNCKYSGCIDSKTIDTSRYCSFKLIRNN